MSCLLFLESYVMHRVLQRVDDLTIVNEGPFLSLSPYSAASNKKMRLVSEIINFYRNRGLLINRSDKRAIM